MRLLRAWLVVLAAAAVVHAAQALPQPKGIIVFFADDLGYGDLGCFGHPTSMTPRIDAVAAAGAKLTQYYSGANICSPSRAGLMTGRLFRRAGVYPGVFSPLSIGGLQHNETTIPELLATKGWTSGMVGKWHLGVEEYHPMMHGFDAYHGPLSTQNECVSNINTPGSATPSGPFGPCPYYNNSEIAEQGHVDMLDIDQRYDDALAAFVRNATAHNVPFFFYFASHHVHAPQFTSAALAGQSIRGLFGDSLHHFDRSVGRAMDLLEELGIAEDVLTVISSDNGGSLQWEELGGVNGDLRCGKGTTWEGGQRVPAIAHWPGTIAAGVDIQGMTSSLDWLQTFASFAGYQAPTDRPLDGFDLSGLLVGAVSESPRNEFFYHSTTTGGPDLGAPGALMAVRKGPYKLHFYTAGSHCKDDFPDAQCYQKMVSHASAPLLYNIERDPGEVVLLSNSTYGEFNATHTYDMVVAELTALAKAHIASFVSAESQIGRGTSPDRFPCCSPACTPRPHCCACPSK